MPEPLTIIYGPTPESRRFALMLGCGFALVGGFLGAISFGLGLMLAMAAPESRSVATGMLCCGAPFGLLFLGVGVWTAFFSGRGEQVVLDAERLTHREHALPIERLVRVAARQDRFRGRIPRWTVTLQDDAGGAIELEATQDRYVGTFDLRGILAALLPRLPATCVVDPKVRAYVAGGRLE